MDQYAGRRHELHTKRLTLEHEHDNEKRSLREQCENKKREVSGKYKQLQEKLAEVRKAKEKRQHELSQALFQAKVAVCKKEREAMRYLSLSFIGFIQRVSGVEVGLC